MRQHDVRGPGGRVLRVYEDGDAAGRAVVVHHGSPSHGALFAPWVDDARRRGIRLIGYDRPGYGASEPDPERTVASAAADVAAIADALGIERFGTWGISGGGPHALACAALLGDRVAGAASLGGVAPFDAAGLNYFNGMGEANVVEFGAALQGRAAIEPFARRQVQEMLAASGPELVAALRTLVSPPDEAALEGAFGAFWSRSMPEAFRQGTVGWLDDDMAFVAPFGFDVAAIAAPVLVWHGRQDRFVPVSHGEWLARAIPGAESHITVDDGHLTLITDRVPEVHAWLLRRLEA
jgi:pimeloyl-ACP methyl ester carboxylesterase